ncbi:MAG TPA: bifunctional phosphoribosyl-AMP cyclohydrolase/phosphoribosyl-ATP diphosphatase HisIE [Lysobacter sp.]
MSEPLAFDASGIDWNKQQGLVAAVVQGATTLRVLMLGWMDRDALARTLATRQATFFSRTRGRLWTKGESSGNVLDVVDLRLDCDGDTLLVLANPRGPTCHLDRASCFPDAPGAFLGELDALIARREAERPAGSYTTKLFDAGVRRIAQKVGEEGVETALAAVAQDEAALLGESADLLYHLTVLLRARGLSLDDAVDVLRTRHAPGPAVAS